VIIWILIATLLATYGVGLPDLVLAQEQESVLTIGWTAGPTNLNPFTIVSQQDTALVYMIHDFLIDYSPELDFIPRLAESFTISPDGLTHTFKLKECYFHDGTPVTSEDVKFTFELAANTTLPCLGFQLPISSIETPDERTVIVHYTSARATIEWLTYLPIVPKHIWKDVPLEEVATHEDATGCGPYKLVEFKRNEVTILEANDKYWQKLNFDRIILKVFMSVDTEISALKAGEIDLMPWEVPERSVKTLTENPNIKVITSPIPYFAAIFINVNPNGTGNPALLDINVRRAMRMAIDKEFLNNVVHLGMRTVATSIIPNGTKWYNPNLQNPPFDLEKAAQILEEAGYKYVSDPNVREKDGVKLSFTLEVINRYPDELRAAEYIRDWWSQIGIQLDVKAEDGGTMWSRVVPNYEFDLQLWGWRFTPDPDYILSTYTTAAIGSLNYDGWSNKTFDQLYEQQAYELNETKRIEIVRKMQEIHFNDIPDIPLYYHTIQMISQPTEQTKLLEL